MAADDELLAAWRAGDNLAGNRLLDRHFEALYRFFWIPGSHWSDRPRQQRAVVCFRG